MAQDVERVGILRVAGRQDLDRLPVAQGEAQVLGLAVRPDEDGLLRQLGADRSSRVEPSRTFGKLELGGVRQNDLHE